MKEGVLSPETNQYFLSVSILTILLTPFIIQYSDNIATKIIHLLFGKKHKYALTKLTSENQDMSKMKNHLVIIGYGVNGTNLVRVATHAEIPYVIIESDIDVVKREKQNGKTIVFGDATDEHTLHMACVENARVVVIAISDSNATKHILSILTLWRFYNNCPYSCGRDYRGLRSMSQILIRIWHGSH